MSLRDSGPQTLLGVSFLKVLENVFEHNDGVVFGRSKQEEGSPPENEDEENV